MAVGALAGIKAIALNPLGYMEENVKKSLKLFKTFTEAGFYGEKDEINRNI